MTITSKGGEMSDWQNMDSAPKDRPILAYGKPTDIDGVRFTAHGVYAVYWHAIHRAYCIKGATWLGPFIKTLCWMEEPAPPELQLTPTQEGKGT